MLSDTGFDKGTLKEVNTPTLVFSRKRKRLQATSIDGDVLKPFLARKKHLNEIRLLMTKSSKFRHLLVKYR